MLGWDFRLEVFMTVSQPFYENLIVLSQLQKNFGVIEDSLLKSDLCKLFCLDFYST